MVRKAPLHKAVGTCLQGYIDISFDELAAKFGIPSRSGSSDGKTQAEWVLMSGGIVITIYDYKENVPAERVHNWHIGGRSPCVVELIQAAFPDAHVEGR